MSTLRLRLLGGFVCEVNESIVDLPFSIQRLTAFLALRGSSNRTLVAGTLWPEVTDSHALASLRTGVWRMNKLIPGMLLAEGAVLAVSPSTVVDSHQQESLATMLLRGNVEDPDSLCTDLDMLWPRELLPGWYDDWVLFERERLSQLRLHALEFTASLLTKRHQLNAALQLALEAVRAEPLRETANAVLISVYIAEGNVSDAMHQYNVFCDRLRRELGVDPSPRLAQLLPRRRAVLTGS